MSANPFKGKKGLSANDYQVFDVADPQTPTSATNRAWSEKFIRLNEFDSTQSYPVGRFVVYSGRLRKANTQTTTGSFVESEWDRLLEQQYPRISAGGLTLQNQDLIFVNNQAQSPTFFLPENPLLGFHIEVVDYLGLSNSNPIRIETTDGRGIQQSDRLAYVIESQFDHVSFYYDGSKWIAKSYSVDRSRIVGAGAFSISISETLFVRNTSGSSDTLIELPANPFPGCYVSVCDVRPVRTRAIKVSSTEFQVDQQSTFVEVGNGDCVSFTFVSPTVGWVSASNSKYVPRDWVYVEQDTTLQMGDKALVHSGSGPVLITLPSFNITEGSSVQVFDYGRQSHINSIKVRSTNRDINGSVDDYTFKLIGENVTFVYIDGEWKTASFDSVKKNVWNAEILTDGQTTVSFPVLNTVSEIFLNSVRLIVDVDFIPDYNTNSLTLTSTVPFKKGDVVTNVTFSSVGMSESSEIVRIVDEQDNRSFFRLRQDGRIERRKLEGLTLDRTEAVTDATVMSKCCSALFYVEDSAKVLQLTRTGLETVYEATVDETIDTITSYQGDPLFVIRTSAEWRFNGEAPNTESLGVVSKIVRRGDYILLQLETEARVYSVTDLTVPFQTIAVSFTDKVYLSEDGSVIVNDSASVNKYSNSVLEWEITLLDIVASCEGEDGEIYIYTDDNEITRINSVGDAVVQYISDSTNIPAGMTYNPNNGQIYAYNTNSIELIDVLNGQLVNAIQLFDTQETLNLEIAR